MTKADSSSRPPEPAEAALRAIREAPNDRPFVVAQLGQSLDGRIATLTGESRWINASAALDHVHRLRAAVDAVVVGIGTVVADDPQPNVRRVAGRNPARVIIDPRGRLAGDARCLGDDGAPRIVVRASNASGAPPLANACETILVPSVEGTLSPPAIVKALFERGMRRLLIEGGATTISAFIAAGAVDRLHVLVAPLIIGSGQSGLSLPPIAQLADAIRPRTEVHVLDDGDVLFDCDLRSDQKGS